MIKIGSRCGCGRIFRSSIIVALVAGASVKSRKDTLVVAYAPGKSITTIVEATDDDETIVKKIDSTLANHVPPIVPEPTNPHKDSGYVFQNWKKDADKHYVPEFKAVEKYGPIVVAYGDKPSDTLEEGLFLRSKRTLSTISNSPSRYLCFTPI